MTADERRLARGSASQAGDSAREKCRDDTSDVRTEGEEASWRQQSRQRAIGMIGQRLRDIRRPRARNLRVRPRPPVCEVWQLAAGHRWRHSQDQRALSLLTRDDGDVGCCLDHDQRDPRQDSRAGRNEWAIGPRQIGRVKFDRRKELGLGVTGARGGSDSQHLTRLDGHHVSRSKQRHRASDVARLPPW